MKLSEYEEKVNKKLEKRKSNVKPGDTILRTSAEDLAKLEVIAGIEDRKLNYMMAKAIKFYINNFEKQLESDKI
jgi:hypothetical protein